MSQCITLVKLCYQKELKDIICVDTSNLAAKGDVIALKAQIDKLDIHKVAMLQLA